MQGPGLPPPLAAKARNSEPIHAKRQWTQFVRHLGTCRQEDGPWFQLFGKCRCVLHFRSDTKAAAESGKTNDLGSALLDSEELFQGRLREPQNLVTEQWVSCVQTPRFNEDPMASAAGKNPLRQGVQETHVEKEHISLLRGHRTERHWNPLTTPDIKDRVFNNRIISRVPLETRARRLQSPLTTNLQGCQVGKDKLDRGFDNLIPVTFNKVAVHCNLATSSRSMEDITRAMIGLWNNHHLTYLDQVRRHDHGFTVGLTPQDSTQERPRQSGTKLSFIRIDQKESKTTFRHQLTRFEVSRGFIWRGQNDTLGQGANCAHLQLHQAGAIRQIESVSINDQLGRVKRLGYVRLGNRLAWVLLLFPLGTNATLFRFLLHNLLQFFRKDKLKDRTTLVGTRFQWPPGLARGQGILDRWETDRLDQQVGPVFELERVDPMFKEQRLETIKGFGFKTSCPNPRSANWHARVQKLDIHWPSSGMKLLDIIQIHGKHLATKHVVNEPNGTQSTVLSDGKGAGHRMHRPRPRTNSRGNALVKGGQTWGRRAWHIPTRRNNAVHSPSPKERDPVMVDTDNTNDGRGAVWQSLNPLWDQSMAGSLESFGSKQRVKNCPRGLTCSLEQLVHVPQQLVISPQGTLVCKNLLSGRNVHRLLSQGSDKRHIRHWGFDHQPKTRGIHFNQDLRTMFRRQTDRDKVSAQWDNTRSRLTLRCVGLPFHSRWDSSILLRVRNGHRFTESPQAQAAGGMIWGQCQARTAVNHFTIRLRIPQDIASSLDHRHNSRTRIRQRSDKRDTVSGVDDSNLIGSSMVRKMDTWCQGRVIKVQVHAGFNWGLWQRLFGDEGKVQVLCNDWNTPSDFFQTVQRHKIALTHENTFNMVLQSRSNPHWMQRRGLLAKAGQTQTEVAWPDHFRHSCQHCHLGWVRVTDSHQVWVIWVGVTSNRKKKSIQSSWHESFMTKAWTPTQTLALGNLWAPWVQSCRCFTWAAKEHLGKTWLIAKKQFKLFTGQFQLRQVFWRHGHGCRQQIHWLGRFRQRVECSDANRTKKTYGQNGPPPAPSGNPNVFQAKDGFGEVKLTLISKRFYLATNHCICRCILYTLKNDYTAAQNICNPKSCPKRCGSLVFSSTLRPSCWEGLTWKTTHDNCRPRMRFVQLLDSGCTVDISMDNWHVRMHGLVGLSHGLRPVHCSYRCHASCFKSDGSNTHSSAKFNQLHVVLHVALAMKQQISWVIHLKSRARCQSYHIGIQGWDTETFCWNVLNPYYSAMLASRVQSNKGHWSSYRINGCHNVDLVPNYNSVMKTEMNWWSWCPPQRHCEETNRVIRNNRGSASAAPPLAGTRSKG